MDCGVVDDGVVAKLREAIDRPIILVWISDRGPGGWKPERLLKKLTWGSFPQLIGKKLYKEVAELFDARLELVTNVSPEKPLNRVTGEPCPYFDSGKKFHTEFHYYPSTESHALLAKSLTPWALEVLGKPAVGASGG